MPGLSIHLLEVLEEVILDSVTIGAFMERLLYARHSSTPFMGITFFDPHEKPGLSYAQGQSKVPLGHVQWEKGAGDGSSRQKGQHMRGWPLRLALRGGPSLAGSPCHYCVPLVRTAPLSRVLPVSTSAFLAPSVFLPTRL